MNCPSVSAAASDAGDAWLEALSSASTERVASAWRARRWFHASTTRTDNICASNSAVAHAS